jgi:transcriptional regulator with XRE-family HTH domain
MGFGLGASSDHRAIEARTSEELTHLITHLTNEITWYMHERGLTRADLANRMGVSPGRISQVLSGGENLTMRTLAGLASALDARFEVTLTPQQPMTGAVGPDVIDSEAPSTVGINQSRLDSSLSGDIDARAAYRP